MATIIQTVPEIPASVTLDGKRALELFANLLHAENVVEDDCGDALSSALAELWREMFGRMFRRCDYGRPDGCETDDPCPACAGGESAAATPLYRFALEAAKSVTA
jgi:hypothetical protein